MDALLFPIATHWHKNFECAERKFFEVTSENFQDFSENSNYRVFRCLVSPSRSWKLFPLLV